MLQWAVKCLAKAGTLSIVGLYPEGRLFPIGEALGKNLTIKAGNTPHRKYIPELVDLVESGVIDPADVLTNGAAHRRDRGLQGVRPAPGGVGQGGAQAAGEGTQGRLGMRQGRMR